MNQAILTREWIVGNWREQYRKHKYDIGACERLFTRFLEVGKLGRGTGDDEIAEEMKDELWEVRRRCVQIAQSECPIGFFRPSWEQAQVLNAWSPNFEPHIAPNGYRSVCNFTTNRGGKTTGSIIDKALWFLPNDPDWKMFETFEDEEGKRHGNDRGNYTVFRRPDWAYWYRTGKLIDAPKDEPPKGPCESWHGVENDQHWNDKVLKEYLKWLPRSALARRADGGSGIYKQERRLELRFGHTITGKTYNSDTQDWAGKAVWAITMDEGFEKRIFDEAMLRVEAGGYFHWPYTVAEPRNIGQRAKLAFDCYSGKHKLVGQAKFFTGFRMDHIPPWIMPADKKADDLERLSREGEVGKVRMGENPFAVSSPTVFSNFERARNILPIDGSDILYAIRTGNAPEKWKADLGVNRAERLALAFLQANLIRGMDEGLANPTACVWTAVLRTGEYVSFREWEQGGLSVGERCSEIIDRSGNKLLLLNPEALEERRRYKELPLPEGMKIRRTFADSKLFKRNPESPQDNWCEVYWRAGLKIERATNIGPAARCDQTNDMLRADPTRQHLVDASKPGARLYITRDCVKLVERLENYLWQQIAQGARAGEFTDKPENKDDHMLDAFSYAACSKLRWFDVDAAATAQPQGVYADPVTGYLSR